MCGAVPLHSLARLNALALIQRLSAEEILFEEGAPAEAMFVVTEGMLKLHKLLRDGRRQIVGFMLPGEILSLSIASRYAYAAEAVTASAVCRLQRGAFLKLVADCPALERALLHAAVTELSAAQEQMLLLGRKRAAERVASFLLAMARRGGRSALEAPLALPMSRNDIADFLGLTVETVSRTLSGLRRQQTIDALDRHTLVIRDPQRLEMVAGA